MVIAEARALVSGLLKRNYLFRRGTHANSSVSGLRSGYSLTNRAHPPSPVLRSLSRLIWKGILMNGHSTL